MKRKVVCLLEKVVFVRESGRIYQVGDRNEHCWFQSHGVNELRTHFINNNGNMTRGIKASAESTCISHHDPFHKRWIGPSKCTAERWDSDMFVSQRCVGRKKAMPVKANLKSIPEVQESSSNQASTCPNDALWHLHDLVLPIWIPKLSTCPSPAPHSWDCSTRQSTQYWRATARTTPLAISWMQVRKTSLLVSGNYGNCDIADCTPNIQESMEQLRSVSLNCY
jgi:hypothetical protein